MEKIIHVILIFKFRAFKFKVGFWSSEKEEWTEERDEKKRTEERDEKKRTEIEIETEASSE
jgi:exonuclease I